MLFPATGEKTEQPLRKIKNLGNPNADKDFNAHPTGQNILVSFSEDAVFKDNLNTNSKNGQRVYIEYQDCGLSEAEPDKFHARIDRVKPGVDDAKHTRPDCHHPDFPKIYLLKG